jgi:hypothetical protein
LPKEGGETMTENSLLAGIWGFVQSLPWELILAAAFGIGVGFYLGKFFAEDKGETKRYEYLSGKRRLRED